MALFQISVQLLAYADDIDIIGGTKWNVTAAFNAIERESIKMGLAINEGKTKCILTTSKNVQHIDSRITADNYTFDSDDDFDSFISIFGEICIQYDIIIIGHFNNNILLDNALTDSKLSRHLPFYFQ